MAYRYSGLRDGAFSDVVDALTSEFAHEIGPVLRFIYRYSYTVHTTL